MIFDYMKTDKYKNYKRNEQIFKEKSSGVFHSTVMSRVKLELMGSGAVVEGDNVFSGFNGSGSQYASISSLIVPNNLLSSVTSAYISYSTSGNVTFNGKESKYMTQKVKDVIKEQSIGGSCLLKIVEKDGQPYINIFNAISYFSKADEFVQDLVGSYIIFNLIEEGKDYDIYLTEEHKDGVIIYRKIKKAQKSDDWEFLETKIEGLIYVETESGITGYSYEKITSPIVVEVKNTCFNSDSDYTDDNIALLRELVVTNTINSQTFDKISNPLLAVPESALESDEHGNAKINLSDRVIIMQGGEGGNKPEQISLDSKIEQSQLHKSNIENQIFSSLAINKSALGLIDVGQLSGEALRRMLSATITRVEEKRDVVATAFKTLANIDVEYSDVVSSSYAEMVKSTKEAVDGGFMSKKKASEKIGNKEDYDQIEKERKEMLGSYDGFADTTA